MSRRPARCRLAAGAIAALLALPPGAALAATVLIVRSAEPATDVTTEAAVRLRGELVAGGFDVDVVDAPAGDPRAALDEATAGSTAVAVVAIVAISSAGTAPGSAELWVVDRVTGKTVVRRLTAELQAAGTRAAEVLAIRALEMLRASSLEVAIGGARARRADEAAARAKAEAAAGPNPNAKGDAAATDGAIGDDTARAGARATAGTAGAKVEVEARTQRAWGFEVGGSVLGGFEGIGPAFVPVVRLEGAFGERFLARLTVAGLGTEAHVSTPAVTVDVAQRLALLEVGLRFGTPGGLRPFVSAGAGALQITADGHTAFPYEGRSSHLWAAIVDAGAGIRFPLGSRFELAAELHALAARPYPAIRFAGAELARGGRPTLLGSVTLVAWM